MVHLSNCNFYAKYKYFANSGHEHYGAFCMLLTFETCFVRRDRKVYIHFYVVHILKTYFVEEGLYCATPLLHSINLRKSFKQKEGMSVITFFKTVVKKIIY